MDQNSSQPQKISQELQQKYSLCSNQYKQLMKTVIAVEDQKKEHLLVLTQIETLNDDRRCFRTIGGILVERNVGEAKVALRHQIDKEIDPKILELRSKLRETEQELLDLEKEMGYKRQDQQEKKEEEKVPEKNLGLLVSN